GQRGVVDRAIYRVDDPGLARRWSGGEGKNRLESPLLQYRDFIVQSAISAGRMGIVERPIAVNESEGGARIALTQKSVRRMQNVDEPDHPVTKIRFAFAIVVKMYLDVRNAAVHHGG